MAKESDEAIEIAPGVFRTKKRTVGPGMVIEDTGPLFGKDKDDKSQ